MRKQRAFASLTEADIEKIAEWLRHETYEVVLERLRKPRPEGFGLDISRSPLATLHAKTNRVERINNRIASGQRLTLAEFDAIQAGEKADLAEEIHDAIMDETLAMATSGENTPTQLLALQRLADFPARAEYRAQRAELEVQKQDHKVQMDLQKNAHKIQMDLEKAAQKKEMDEHRKLMAEERLILAKRALDLREKTLEARGAKNSALCTPDSALEDDLGPLASTLDEIEARATKKFCLPPIAPAHTHTPQLSEPHDSDTTAESQPPAGANSTESSEPSTHATANSSLINTGPSHEVARQSCCSVFQTGDHSIALNPPTVSTVSPQPSLNELAIQSSNNLWLCT